MAKTRKHGAGVGHGLQTVQAAPLAIPVFLDRTRGFTREQIDAKREELNALAKNDQWKATTKWVQPTQRTEDELKAIAAIQAELEQSKRVKAHNRAQKMVATARDTPPPNSRWDQRLGKWVLDPQLAKDNPTPKAPAPRKSGRAVSEGKRPGIIAHIRTLMSRPEGASVSEVVAALVQQFPERDIMGMTTTAKIQTKKLSTGNKNVAKRGMVFYRKGD